MSDERRLRSLADELSEANGEFDAYRILCLVGETEFADFAGLAHDLLHDPESTDGSRDGRIYARLLAGQMAGYNLRIAGFLIGYFVPEFDTEKPLLDRLLDGAKFSASLDASTRQTHRTLAYELLTLLRNDMLPPPVALRAIHACAASFVAYGDEDLLAIALELYEGLDPPPEDAAEFAGAGALLYNFKFTYTDQEQDIGHALEIGARAIQMAGPTSELRGRLLSNQANILTAYYKHNGGRQVLNDAIEAARDALEIMDGDEEVGVVRETYASLLALRYELTARPDDLDLAIEAGGQALIEISRSMRPAHDTAHNHANRLTRRYDRYGNEDDLDEAILLGSQSLAGLHDDTSWGTWAILADGQAGRLERRFQSAGDERDIEEATTIGRRILAEAPATTSESQIGIYVNNLATRLLFVAQHSGDSGPLDEAIELGRRGLQSVPSTSPMRTLALSNQVGRLLERFERAPRAEDVAEIEAFLIEWTDAAGSGLGNAISVLGSGRRLVKEAAHLAGEEDLDWSLVARLGRAVLKRADELTALIDPGLALERVEIGEAELSARKSVDGIASIACFALHQLGRSEDAVELLERAGATIARLQGSAIDWDDALAVEPELTAEVLELRSRMLVEAGGGPVTSSGELGTLIFRLRNALGLPQVEPVSLSDLSSWVGPHVWLLSTDFGGVAFRHVSGTVEACDLPDLASPMLQSWNKLLFPGAVDDSVRARTQQYRGWSFGGRYELNRADPDLDPPGSGAVTRVLDEMVEVLSPVSEWMEQADWLIPTGATRLLPWSYCFPTPRLHFSCSQAIYSDRAAVRASSDEGNRRGAVVCFADPTNDLPGARAEGEWLESLGARVYFGDDASLRNLIALDERVHTLHIAAHATAEPSVVLAGGERLSLDELHLVQPLLRRTRRLLLNCCFSAGYVTGLNDEALSFANMALALGVQSVTVALWPIGDSSAATWARSLYGLGPRPRAPEVSAAYLSYGLRWHDADSQTSG